jgi:hypothetical protein
VARPIIRKGGKADRNGEVLDSVATPCLKGNQRLHSSGNATVVRSRSSFLPQKTIITPIQASVPPPCSRGALKMPRDCRGVQNTHLFTRTLSTRCTMQSPIERDQFK